MYKRIEHAKDLPPEWESICKDNIYMSKHFMEYMERVNYCNQSYHLFYENNKLYSCFMMFERKFNILIFTNKYKLNCNMKFIYLPLSVSHPSIVFGENMCEVGKVLNEMNGVKIIINTDDTQNIDNFTRGNYLPICVLENKWSSFENYLESMRASYRRRIKQAMKKGKGIVYEELDDNNKFTDEMYNLYEQVMEHSVYSLEKLNVDFFKNDISKIILMKIDDKVEAFVQLIEDRNNDMLIFEFCGYNYEKAHEYDLYYNLLIKITSYAIENNFRYIQFGQTAYDAKLKFGAKMYYNYFLLSHKNKFINWLINKYIHFMEYKVENYSFKVFKGDTDDENYVSTTKTTS